MAMKRVIDPITGDEVLVEDTGSGPAPIRPEVRDYLQAKAAPPAEQPSVPAEEPEPAAPADVSEGSRWKPAAILAALSGIGGLADGMTAEAGQKTNYGGNIAEIFGKSVERGIESKREAVRQALEQKKADEAKRQWEEEMKEKVRTADMTDKRSRELAEATRSSQEESRKAAAEERKTNRTNREDDKDETRIQGIRKEITGSKSYQGWLDIKNASDNLKDAVANPSSKRSLGAVYSWVKALDPGSVVREGEIKLAGEARSLSQKLEGSFLKMAKGQVLTTEEIKELSDWAATKAKIARDAAIASNKPAIEQAKRNKYDLAEINSDLFGPEPEEEEKSGPDEHGYVVGQQYQMKDGNMATYLGNGEFE